MNADFLTIEEIEQVAEGFKDDLTRQGKRSVRLKNLDRAVVAFAAEEYIDHFVETLRMRAKSQLGRAKEPKKRIRAIYIPEAVKKSARVPLSKEQKKQQADARAVAEASRCHGHPKHY